MDMRDVIDRDEECEMQREASGAWSEVQSGKNRPRSTRLPLVIYVMAIGTFLMLTTEFVAAGILPQLAADFRVNVAQTGC
ncbi:hypothetical protein AB6813_22165 [bacterium RCC_150]